MVKRIFSIITPVIILAAGINLSFAVHTCHSHFAGWKVSFTEEKASCGMPAENENVPAEGAVHSDCCRDKVSHLRVDENFNPSFIILNKLSAACVQLFFVPDNFPENPEPFASTFIADTGPPAGFYSGSAHLSSICIYRI